MPPKLRRKRASPTDLYKSCKAGGDCIPDVKNKFENDTWADRLLRWFGNIIYLGGLGIGTGKGTGGSSGYRPLQPGSSGRVPTTVPVRPTIPVETVPEIPTGFITPEAPSIIPMVELPIDTSVVIDTITNIGPTDPVLDVSVLYETSNPTYDPTIIAVQPTSIETSSGTTEVIIGRSMPPATSIVLENIAGVEGIIDAPSHADAYNIFVDPLGSGTGIGALEEIELGTLSNTFDIEPQRTSTPSFPTRFVQRGRDLYNRFVQQLPTRNPAFLDRPSRLVTFGFENPAFTNEDLTLRFMDDVNEIAAAPDTDFADVRVLHRQQLNETPGGTVRVSRLGTKGFMSTRSGVLVGQKAHFYYDISSIENADALELMPIGVSHSSAEVVDGLAESSIVDYPLNNPLYPDEDLYDELVENFDNSHLVLSTTDESGRAVFVSLSAPWTPKIFIADTQNGYFVEVPAVYLSPSDSIRPTVLSSDFLSDDYYLHPSLRRRRRKRKYPFVF